MLMDIVGESMNELLSDKPLLYSTADEPYDLSDDDHKPFHDSVEDTK